MIFDDSTTALTFFPTAYSLLVEDPTVLQTNSAGKVIAAGSPSGAPLKRKRKLQLHLTSAEVTSYKSFYNTNDGSVFQFTDSNGRIWDCYWLGSYGRNELNYIGEGNYRLNVDLLLTAVNSDAGTTAYGNTDVSQGSIQVSGGSILYLPISYTPQLNVTDISTLYKLEGVNNLFSDASRFTAKKQEMWGFNYLSDSFVTSFEDYIVDTLKGSANPFSAIMYRGASIDFTRNYRLLGGLSLTQDINSRWSCDLQVMEEI